MKTSYVRDWLYLKEKNGFIHRLIFKISYYSMCLIKISYSFDFSASRCTIRKFKKELFCMKNREEFVKGNKKAEK